ncbi:4-hydroxy-tetrahydrodipicolinate reductase [Sphingorhabdus lutea]|nr:4-hydroxy-tetrahydrodipicolinate reductase [Sphingorhabdus lutea]
MMSDKEQLRMGIIGSNGRMGNVLISAIKQAGHLHMGGVDKDDDLDALASNCDILIDFSAPAALEDNLDIAMNHALPIIIGTTGLEERHHFLIDSAAQDIPIMQTGNTSMGVTMLAYLVEEAAAKLGDAWDIEIVEMHHRHKVDAPSGTAKLLGEAAAKGRGIKLSEHKDSGRDGITGTRKIGDIGFAALRGGSVAGDHDVIFAGDEELMTLSHRAENRMIFARGAVQAAYWLSRQKPGRYNMRDVLGL